MEFKFRKTDEIMENYDGKVKESIQLAENKFLNELLGTDIVNGGSMFDKCQSPIEQILYIYLSEQRIYSEYDIQIEPQYKIKGGKYIIDFRIVIVDSASIQNENGFDYWEKQAELLVECDGHDFHEKTKKQVSDDKKRDREILKEGLKLIRFTGSEIYNKPSKCATETIKILERMLMEEPYKEFQWGV